MLLKGLEDEVGVFDGALAKDNSFLLAFGTHLEVFVLSHLHLKALHLNSNFTLFKKQI